MRIHPLEAINVCVTDSNLGPLLHVPPLSAVWMSVLLCLSQAYVSMFSYTFWPEAQTGLENPPQYPHRFPKCLTQKTQRNAYTNAHTLHKKAVHVRAHTTMLPKQIRSDASACACQEHAARERENVRGVTCLLVQKHIYKINGIQADRSLSEKDTKARYNYSLSVCVCFHWETLSNTRQLQFTRNMRTNPLKDRTTYLF